MWEFSTTLKRNDWQNNNNVNHKRIEKYHFNETRAMIIASNFCISKTQT
jgi:hypothetical protein